jgi:hypothetical protein
MFAMGRAGMSWNGVIGLEGGEVCARVLKEGMHDSRRRRGESEVGILRPEAI